MAGEKYIFLEDIVKRVYEQLGYGLSELTYEKCLTAELTEIVPIVQSEYHVNEYYITRTGRQIQIADLRIDILINNDCILELKTLENSFNKKKNLKETKEYKQIRRYMKIMNINEGYLINFFRNGFDFIRIN